MTAKLQLVFRDMDHTNPVAAHVEDRFARLRRIQPDIIRCRTVLSQPHRSKRMGNAFRVGVTLAVPGWGLLAQSSTDQDLYTAIYRGFQALERQLRTVHSKRSNHVDVGRPDMDLDLAS